MLFKSSLCSLYSLGINGVAYKNININATSTTTIKAGLTNLIVNAAINNDAINTNSADITDDVVDPGTNVFSGSAPNVLFNVSINLSYIFMISPYNVKADKARTPSLLVTISGHKPMTRQMIRNKNITAIVVFGTLAEDISKSSGFGLRNIAYVIFKNAKNVTILNIIIMIANSGIPAVIAA